MRKLFWLIFLMIGFLFIISSSDALAVCEGSLSYTCGPTYPNNKLNISWNVTNEWGACNIYVQDNTGDHRISTNCSSNGTQVLSSVDGRPITNDGHYKLFVSNGGSCLNQQKGDITLNCASAPPAPACDSSQVNMSYSPNPGVVGQNITFNISGTQGSTLMGDSWSGGVNCSGNFWGNKTCGATSQGTFTWTHTWQNCGDWTCATKSPVCYASKQYTIGTSNSISCSNATGQVSPSQVRPGDSVALQINGDASTFYNDTTGAGLSCSGGWNFDANPKTMFCTATNNTGNFTWVHSWKACTPNCTDESCCTTSCSLQGNYTVLGAPTATSTPTNTPTLTPTATPTPPPNVTATSTPTNTPTPTLTPTASPTPAVYTLTYRYAENLADLNNAPSYNYTSQPLTFTYSFKDKTPGIKTLFVEFTDSTGRKDVRQKSITLLPPGPKINSISCSYDVLTGIGTIAKISGSDFGASGSATVKLDNQTARIQSWTDVLSSTSSASSSAVPSSKSTVVARVGTRLDGEIPVNLTLNNGTQLEGSCILDTTTVNFSAYAQCAPTNNLSLSDVEVQIYDEEGGNRALYDEIVSLNSKGKPTNFAPQLEIGRDYALFVKAPRSVAQRVDFTALEGTTVLSMLELAIGNISSNRGGLPDSRIDTFDVSKLYQQWSLIQSVQKTGDFNLDTRVNSVDYSCLISNWGKEDAKF